MAARARLNLAARPFENRRPVRRLAVLLWCLGGLFAMLDVWSYFRYFSGSSEGHGELDEITRQIEEEATEGRRLGAALAAFDLETQNEQVDFLNRRIVQRTFPWGRLFDHLSEVMPRGVRLNSLAPTQPGELQQRGPGRASARRLRERSSVGDRVPLSLDGQAEDHEQVLSFVDALFAHPAFVSPSLLGESSIDSSMENGEIRFTLQVDYLARRAEQAGDPVDDVVLEATGSSLVGPLGNASDSPRISLEGAR